MLCITSKSWLVNGFPGTVTYLHISSLNVSLFYVHSVGLYHHASSEIYPYIGLTLLKLPVLTYFTSTLYRRLVWPHWNFAQLFDIWIQNPWVIARHRSFDDPTFSDFGKIPACDRQKDRQTEDCSMYRVSISLHGKNHNFTRESGGEVL